MFCYLCIDKRTKFPFIGIVEGQKNEYFASDQVNRSRLKDLQINPNEYIPDYIEEVLDLYKDGDN